MSAVRSTAVEMVVCDQLLGEVRRGMEGSYFQWRLTDEQREEILAAIARIGLRMADPVSPPRVVRDPKDDYLVALIRVPPMSRTAQI